MALRMRKDIKKSSYYVWFLGAQESKGLRGAEYVVPVVKSLVQRERDVEPFKVTLQVSHKGLKIIQNVPPSAANPAKPPGKNAKAEVVKHFIPHHAVTCVLQDEDIVACILLLYNPVTKCPVHVHAYRCDSVETAEILRGQLQTLIERPDNQKKLGEIETRLRAKGLLLPPGRIPNGGGGVPPPGAPRRVTNGGGSDGRSTSTRESESSGGSSSERLSGVGGQQERIASLYDSLAAELREKLGTGGTVGGTGGGPAADSKPRHPQAPILLPPRDYDTVHRQKGNLTAIDLRRCLNANIVGVNAKNTKNLKDGGKGGGGGGTGRTPGSSGGSSGIGSDHAPSPDQHDRESDPRYLDSQSTSDEDWAEQPSEDSLFLVQPGRGHTTPNTTTTTNSSGQHSWRGPGTDLSLPRARRLHSGNPPPEPTPPPPAQPPPPVDYRRRRHEDPVPAPSSPSPVNGDFRRRRQAEERQRSPSPTKNHNGGLSPRDRFKDAKEKFLLLEKERLEEQERVKNDRRRQNIEPPISPAVVAPSNPRNYRAGSWSRSRDSEDDLEDRQPPRGPTGGYYPPPGREFEEEVFNDEDEVFEQEKLPDRLRGRNNRLTRRDSRGRRPLEVELDERSPTRHRRIPDAYHRGSPVSPSNRNLPPQHNYEAEHNRRAAPRRYRQEEFHHSPERRAMVSAPAPRYHSPTRNPRPAPRGAVPEKHFNPHEEAIEDSPRYRARNPQYGDEIPLQRYRSPVRQPQPAPRHRVPAGVPERDASPDRRQQAQYQKRRSMFDAVEEERRRNSHELAREFKRRSYQEGDQGGAPPAGYHGYQELPDRDRFPGLDRETARMQTQHRGGGAGYRHSYAEGPMHHEMLHRTNSSVSSGRVGIAAVHPY